MIKYYQEGKIDKSVFTEMKDIPALWLPLLIQYDLVPQTLLPTPYGCSVGYFLDKQDNFSLVEKGKVSTTLF